MIKTASVWVSEESSHIASKAHTFDSVQKIKPLGSLKKFYSRMSCDTIDGNLEPEDHLDDAYEVLHFNNLIILDWIKEKFFTFTNLQYNIC